MHYLDTGSIINTPNPPLVILLGTAQTIETYSPHISALSKHRRVIIPELRGQGKTQLNTTHASMEQHVADFCNFLKTLDVHKIDLVGFSFGGRVAACVAAYHPHLVNKLSLTGVPYIRPALGKIIITSWAELLAKNNIKDCAWSFLINGYSPAFIEKYESKLPDYVDAIVEANEPRKLFDLISQSSSSPLHDDDPFSVSYCAAKIT
eukprot:gene40204-54365_t